MSVQSDFVCLAKIVSSHGLHGLLKVELFMSDIEALDSYGELTTDYESFYEVTVAHVISPKYAVFKIDGIGSIDQTRSMIGKCLYVHKSKLPELDEDQFYFNDLIGLDVHLHESKQLYGKVVGVHNFGSCDIIEILLAATPQKRIMHTFTCDVFPEINMKDKIMFMHDCEIAG